MSADPYAKMRVAAWRDALKVLAVQATTMVAIGAAGAVVWGPKPGLGLLLGAGIGLIANIYLAIVLLGKPLLQQKAGGVLMSWIVKVGLTLSLLLIALRANYVPPLSLIAGISSVFIAQWLAVSFWLRGRR